MGHTGPGGTTPRDRAAAAGYPLGTYFSENWQSGYNMTASGAVTAWQGDSLHLNTMLSASMTEAGGGISKSGSTYYFVLDAGAPDGTIYVSTVTVTPGGPTVTPVTPGTPIVSQFMVPVTLNTPDASGFIYHEVAYGQSLWSIAIAYGTKIDAIKQLNNLGDTEIYVGQKLLVLKGPTPMPSTPTQPATSTSAPVTTTSSISVEASLTPVTLTAVTATGTSTPAASVRKNSFNFTALGIILAALVFAALGTWMGTRKSV